MTWHTNTTGGPTDRPQGPEVRKSGRESVLGTSITYERGVRGSLYQIGGVTNFDSVGGMMIVDHVVSTADGVEHHRRTRFPEKLLVCIEEDL